MNLNWLEQAAQLTIVLGFCGGVFSYLVIRPLNESIKRVEEVLAGIREDLKNDNTRINRLEGEVLEIKYGMQKAHDRLDALLKETTK
ncbi:MAG: hypothetical protein IKP64_13335 [Selenomonadaceae bacterium]|nr:hypothetical protein [Selenomonadaceae bacterium]